MGEDKMVGGRTKETKSKNLQSVKGCSAAISEIHTFVLSPKCQVNFSYVKETVQHGSLAPKYGRLLMRLACCNTPSMRKLPSRSNVLRTIEQAVKCNSSITKCLDP